jgi:hypothetical protein
MKLFDRLAKTVSTKTVANIVPDVANKDDAMANTMANTYKYRDVEKRRGYQRELMRRRRLESRAQKKSA